MVLKIFILSTIKITQNLTLCQEPSIHNQKYTQYVFSYLLMDVGVLSQSVLKPPFALVVILLCSNLHINSVLFLFWTDLPADDQFHQPFLYHIHSLVEILLKCTIQLVKLESTLLLLLKSLVKPYNSSPFSFHLVNSTMKLSSL